MSLWTRTPMFVPTRGPMLIQTLAVNLAARVFAETEFVTDQRGAEIAALLGWPFGKVSHAARRLACGRAHAHLGARQARRVRAAGAALRAVRQRRAALQTTAQAAHAASAHRAVAGLSALLHLARYAGSAGARGLRSRRRGLQRRTARRQRRGARARLRLGGPRSRAEVPWLSAQRHHDLDDHRAVSARVFSPGASAWKSARCCRSLRRGSRWRRPATRTSPAARSARTNGSPKPRRGSRRISRKPTNASSPNGLGWRRTRRRDGSARDCSAAVIAASF